jgi:hypothetical protein
MSISVICAPELTRQVYVPPPVEKAAPRLDDLDKLLLERLRNVGTCQVWQLLNMVANEEGPRDRTEGRFFRLELLSRLSRLRRLGLAFGVGRNGISIAKPIPTRRQTRRVRRNLRSMPQPTVGQSASVWDVSACKPPERTPSPQIAYKAHPELITAHSSPHTTPVQAQKTHSALQRGQVSQAARTLARLPRNQPRRWTGWLHGRHCWRGQLVVLPNGEITKLVWCSRGRVLLSDANDVPYDSWLLRVARREQDVRLYHHPAAQLLGSLKAGTRERPSALKSATARQNGARPTRPGRRRGRPRKHIYQHAQLAS